MRKMGYGFVLQIDGKDLLIGAPCTDIAGSMSNKCRVLDAGEAIGKNRASDLKVANGLSIDGVMLSAQCGPVAERAESPIGLLY